MNPEEQTLYNSLQGDPENWQLRFSLIDSLNARGAHADSVAIIAEAPVAPSTEGELRKILSTCRDGDRIEVAGPFIEAFLAGVPSSGLAHYLYAKYLSKTGGDLAKAREHYQAAVALNSELEDEILAAKLADLGGTVPQEAEPQEPQIQSLTPPPGHSTSSQRVHAEVPQLIQPDAPDAEEEAIAHDMVEADTPDVAFGEETVEPIGEDGHHTGRYLLVSDGEKVQPHEKASETPTKLSAIVIAVIAHIAILFAMALVVLNIPDRRPPEIVAQAPPLLDDTAIEKQEIQKVVQRKPIQAASQAEVITVAGASAVAMPDIQTDLNSFDPIGMGESFGASMSFDAGEDGGMVSFFGSRSVSKKVVFAVDYSASMSSQNKDVLMRKELSKSLNALPGGINYQVIFFAGPAWVHGQNVKSEKGNDTFLVTPERGREEWKWIRGFDPKDKRTGALYHPDWGLDPEELPKAEYLTSSRSNIRNSIKIVEDTKLVYGTDWRWPLYAAINMEPDTIFFMTDGAFGAPNKDRLIDDLISYSKKKGRPKINTICMMVLNAEKELSELADKTRGEFTLVLQDQTVVRGKELEEMKKKGK